MLDPKSNTRAQLASVVTFTQAAIVKSAYALTMPLGSVAVPPLKLTAFPLTPAVKLVAPLSVPFLLLPDESVSVDPKLELALYQTAGAATVTVAVPKTEPTVARTVPDPAAAGAV